MTYTVQTYFFLRIDVIMVEICVETMFQIYILSFRKTDFPNPYLVVLVFNTSIFTIGLLKLYII